MVRLYDKLCARNRFPMWVVYGPHTREYPGQYVARMFVALPKEKVTRFVMTHDTLEELRALLPQGLHCFHRAPSDAPEIIETWF